MTNLKKYLENFKGNRVLMAIYPHPDDESVGAAGLLLAAKKYGFKTVVVTLTKGEEGWAHAGGIKGRPLKVLREKELNKALKVLQVDQLELGDFDDGLLRQEKGQWNKWLASVVKKYSPGIIVTYDHSGMYGHPDHIVLSLVVKEIVKKLPSADRPDLFWTSFAGMARSQMNRGEIAKYAQYPSHYLDLGWSSINKWRAMKAHASQKMGKDLPVPLLLVNLIFRREWYHQVDLNKEYAHKFIELDYITDLLKRKGLIKK